MRKNLLILIAALGAVQCASTQTPLRMTVQINGLREAVGQVMVFVFNNQDDFPTKRDRAVASKKVPVDSSSMVVSFDSIPEGVYGVAVYHDENSNNKMDRSWYGMPKEGYGASNDATGTFGPPSFKDAKFNFNNSQDTIKIFIHY